MTHKYTTTVRAWSVHDGICGLGPQVIVPSPGSDRTVWNLYEVQTIKLDNATALTTWTWVDDQSVDTWMEQAVHLPECSEKAHQETAYPPIPPCRTIRGMDNVTRFFGNFKERGQEALPGGYSLELDTNAGVNYRMRRTHNGVTTVTDTGVASISNESWPALEKRLENAGWIVQKDDERRVPRYDNDKCIMKFCDNLRNRQGLCTPCHDYVTNGDLVFLNLECPEWIRESAISIVNAGARNKLDVLFLANNLVKECAKRLLAALATGR